MADTQTIGPYTVGEKPPPLVYRFLDSSGAPMNLTGYSATFQYRRSDGAATVGLATVTGPTNGEVTHTWTGSELSTPGTWWCEFWVGNTTNRFASNRLDAVVRAPVGTVPAI